MCRFPAFIGRPARPGESRPFRASTRLLAITQGFRCAPPWALESRPVGAVFDRGSSVWCNNRTPQAEMPKPIDIGPARRSLLLAVYKNIASLARRYPQRHKVFRQEGRILRVHFATRGELRRHSRRRESQPAFPSPNVAAVPRVPEIGSTQLRTNVLPIPSVGDVLLDPGFR
jgi:hypothetical protein